MNINTDEVAEERYSLTTPVLFLVFNRPDSTERVFEAIRTARPSRLYIAADGPRSSRSGEHTRTEQVREIVSKVDWPCVVKKLYRTENLGCKRAVSEGISWFFMQEERGIILEDDCLPHQDFFRFCEEMLRKYANDKQIWAITGDNFHSGATHGDASYYFSRYNHIWGWASWRRAWQHADMDLKFWPKWRENGWNYFWCDEAIRTYWGRIFDRMHRSEIDTWDYPWLASVWFHGGLTVTPNVNLVSNIGFGPDSTHTKSSNSECAFIKTHPLGELTHPSSVQWNEEADNAFFYNMVLTQKKGVLRFSIAVVRRLIYWVAGMAGVRYYMTCIIKKIKTHL